jgi:hypothetical protein
VILRIANIVGKRLIKRWILHGVPGSQARLVQRARARSRRSSPNTSAADASARGYRGLALAAIVRGELPLPPPGYDPYDRCPPGWGYADYVDGSVACLPPLRGTRSCPAQDSRSLATRPAMR